ncbi:hypothetical protein [Psychrobacillus phage Perkons]|nr:hypothetical protein [Psychrobacillus phage Perkons]
MKIERQISMVKSAAKNMRQKDRQEKPKEKIIDKMYKILNGLGTTLDEVNGSKLSERDYNSLIEYFKVIRGMNTYEKITLFYPNMKR